MTPSEVLAAARDQYNAASDPFFTDGQMLNFMWQACNELAREAQVIERVYSATTVAGQQTYSYPTNTIEIKRVTYRGIKLKRLTFREDDAVTISNAASLQSGRPVYYSDFNFTLYLRPIPDDAQTLQIYSYNLHQVITAASTLEIPTLFHMSLVYPLLRNMYAKDQNEQMSMYYDGLWKQEILAAKRWKQKQKRSDSFATVQDEGILPVTIMGEV